MDTFQISPHARRRLFLENLQRKVRKRAWERYSSQFRDYERRHYWDLHDIYTGLMCNEGHWMYGGCRRARCGLCQPTVPAYRDRRQKDQFDREYRAWRNGKLDG